MSTNDWNAELYDEQLGYVSQYGKSVVSLLHPQSGERILDLGCGTGDLSQEITSLGSQVIGIDSSVSMIDKARVKYPALEFIVGDGEDFKFEEKFDAVFSNAALHWMKRPQQVISCVGKALRKEGRFVAEFGGAGNVEIITDAIIQVISETHHMKVDHLDPWYFPSIGQYTSLLEQQGFQVKYAHHFDRPTQLEDGEHGLHHWLNSFADSFFVGYTEVEKTVLFNKIADQVKPVLFHDGSWHADYKRLRIVAINTQPSMIKGC